MQLTDYLKEVLGSNEINLDRLNSHLQSLPPTGKRVDYLSTRCLLCLDHVIDVTFASALRSLNTIAKCSQLKSHDIISSIDKFTEKVHFLRSELAVSRSLNGNCKIAEGLTEKYLSNLSKYLDSFEKYARELDSCKNEIIDRIAELNAHFNEDPAADSCIVFYSLNQLLLSIASRDS